MGVSASDLFGGQQPQSATPGSYGEPPRGYRLPKETRLGTVRLQVRDLERSMNFYRETLGLRIIDDEGTRATLGPVDDDRVLVELVENKHARRAETRVLGLFHFALLLPDRGSLGRFVRHLANRGTPFGSGDHLVSEALYLSDPDGLGIEVYADRPRQLWRRIGRELMIATDPLNVAGLVEAAGDETWRGMPAGSVVGHVHLRVGDLALTKAFFSEALGFDRITWRYPGALFMSAGGYHHHLGTNTWGSTGARTATEDDARLLEWTIELPSEDDVAAAAASLDHAGYRVEKTTTSGVLTTDPWNTPIRLCSSDTSPRH